MERTLALDVMSGEMNPFVSIRGQAASRVRCADAAERRLGIKHTRELKELEHDAVRLLGLDETTLTVSK